MWGGHLIQKKKCSPEILSEFCNLNDLFNIFQNVHSQTYFSNLKITSRNVYFEVFFRICNLESIFESINMFQNINY